MRQAFIAFIVILGIAVMAGCRRTDTFPEEIISERDGATMRWIPAGKFEIGSNDGEDNEKPIHTVSVHCVAARGTTPMAMSASLAVSGAIRDTRTTTKVFAACPSDGRTTRAHPRVEFMSL